MEAVRQHHCAITAATPQKSTGLRDQRLVGTDEMSHEAETCRAPAALPRGVESRPDGRVFREGLQSAQRS